MKPFSVFSLLLFLDGEERVTDVRRGDERRRPRRSDGGNESTAADVVAAAAAAAAAAAHEVGQVCVGERGIC